MRRELAGRPNPHDKALCEDILAGRTTLAQPGLLADLRRRVLGLDELLVLNDFEGHRLMYRVSVVGTAAR